MYRTPATTQEAKAYEAATAQGVKVRARRNPRNLPNSYDDKPRSRSYSANNWKRHRKNQYRATAAAL